VRDWFTKPTSGAPLAAAADARLAATLEAVIVPGSPAAWAYDAEWDEYRLKVRSLASEMATVIRVALVDALGDSVAARVGRLALAEGSRETQQRYAASGKLARGEADGSWMILGGTATAVGGAFMGSAAALGSVVSMGAVSSGAATAVAVAPALMLGGAGVITGGVMQMRNNAEVDRAIRERQTTLPVFVAPGEEAMLDVFFPVTPLPRAVAITYMDSKGTHSLLLETQALLARAHVPAR
jgi:hypothetical protein